MSQELVDTYCKELSKVHYMPVSETAFSAIPREVRGVPHYSTVGVHEYLTPLADAFETIRNELGLEDRKTCSTLQCLPFGPYSERLASNVPEMQNPTTSSRVRNPEDDVDSAGRTFSVDNTCADVSVLTEPLLLRQSMTCSSDNIFSTGHLYAQSFRNCAVCIGTWAELHYLSVYETEGKPVDIIHSFLFDSLQSFHELYDGHPDEVNFELGHTSHQFAADIMVLINCMYPTGWEISKSTILDAYSKAPRLCYEASVAQASGCCAEERCNSGSSCIGLPLRDMKEITDEEKQAAFKFWGAFTRRHHCGAWMRLEALLIDILTHKGSYDQSLGEIRKSRHILEHAIRNVWYIHSEDGRKAPKSPSPLAGISSHMQITSEHVNPKFVGGKSAKIWDASLSKYTCEKYKARGSVIGLMPMAINQVMALLQAVNLDDTVCQYYRNEGQLCLRGSSAADVLTKGGKQRSSKAISAVGTEGDEAAFGSRKEKLKMCKLQREAYDKNLKLMMPLCTRICPPRPANERSRGDAQAVEFIKSKKRELDRANVMTSQEINANKLFDKAIGAALDDVFPPVSKKQRVD